MRVRQRPDVFGFNPRTPCGVRQAAGNMAETFLYVSIHALLAECDPAQLKNLKVKLKFQSTHSLRSATSNDPSRRDDTPVSIHALLAECDGHSAIPSGPCRPFQSTHSLRSATHFPVRRGRNDYGFNPRTPCGVRPSWSARSIACARFQSTHSLRSATGFRGGKRSHCRQFQSTHSLRSATYYEEAGRYAYVVSIHALLAECDPTKQNEKEHIR